MLNLQNIQLTKSILIVWDIKWIEQYRHRDVKYAIEGAENEDKYFGNL